MSKPFSPVKMCEQHIGYDLKDYSTRTPPLIKGIHRIFIGILIRLEVMMIAFRIYKNLLSVIKVLKGLEFLRRNYMGNYKVKKIFKVDGRYYWDMHAPGWPSAAFKKYNEGEMNRIIPFRPVTDYLNSMIFSITKKCPLRCLHCYEWDELNQEDTLSVDELKAIVKKFQERGKGVAQIQFSGGEPLKRYDDIIRILESSKTDTDFWVVTSGYKLTLKKAKCLKSAGLRGVAISLDHYIPSIHNYFRGKDDSFKWIINGIRNAHEVKLMVILCLCVTRDFVSWENLMNYAFLAKWLGISYILLIEPRAVGRYKGKDVALNETQLNILEDFYLKLNFDPAYSELPAVSYHGYHQRRIGCFGGGNRYVYVNANGNLQVCPFCRLEYGNVLVNAINDITVRMKSNGCQPYKQAII